MPTLKAVRYIANILSFLLIQFRYSLLLSRFSCRHETSPALRDDIKNGCVADYFRYGPYTGPIRYVTLHLRDRRGAASLRYRNRAGITVRWPLGPRVRGDYWAEFCVVTEFLFHFVFVFDHSHQTLTHLILAASDCYGINITTFAILPDISRETIWRWGTTP